LRALFNTIQFYQHAPNNWRSSTRRTPSARVVSLRFTCNRSSLSWRSASVLRGGCAPTAAMPGVRDTTSCARTISDRGRLTPVCIQHGASMASTGMWMGRRERKGWRRSPNAGEQPVYSALAPRSRALRPYQGAVAPDEMIRAQDETQSVASRQSSVELRTSACDRTRFSVSRTARTQHTLAGAGDAGIPATPSGRMWHTHRPDKNNLSG
jgi:hypothetical protein